MEIKEEKVQIKVEEQSTKISENKWPYFWTLHGKQVERSSKLETLYWIAIPVKSNRKLTSHKNNKKNQDQISYKVIRRE